MSHYIQDEKCCEIVENERFGQFLYCNVCHKRCFDSYSKAMSEIRRQHRSKNKHHDICSRAYQCDKCGYWHLTSHAPSATSERIKRIRFQKKKNRLSEAY